MEQTFAVAALVLCVGAAVVFGCYKVYSRLRYLVSHTFCSTLVEFPPDFCHVLVTVCRFQVSWAIYWTRRGWCKIADIAGGHA